MVCKLVIPGVFAACGEEGQYCSEECLLKAQNAVLREALEEALAYVPEYFKQKWPSMEAALVFGMPLLK